MKYSASQVEKAVEEAWPQAESAREAVELVMGQLKSLEKKPSKGAGLSKRGVEAAARFMERNGYTVLERGWKCKHGGFDIIASDGVTLVFADVRTRRDNDTGFPQDWAGEKKRRQFELASIAYVRDNLLGEQSVRYDIFSIVVAGNGQAMVRHHINAIAED